MAYRVAELMDRAKHAKTKAKKEAAEKDCTEVIISLWAHREKWPHRRPLSELIEVVEQFANWSRPNNISVDQAKRSTWLGILPFIISLQENEREWCRRAAIAEFPIEKELKRLKEAPDDFSEDERKLVETIAELRGDLDNALLSTVELKIKGFAALPGRKRTELVLSELASLNSQRVKLLNRVRIRRRSNRKRTRKTR